MGKKNRCGHEFRRLIAGITKHHALITCALFFECAVPLIDTLRNVRRLLVQRHKNGASVAIESHVGAGVANATDLLAGNFRVVDLSIGRR